MITIYTHKVSTRLEYTLNFILKEYFGIDFTIETDAVRFRDSEGAKINYSMDDFGGTLQNKAFHIFPTLLLFQEDLTEHQITVKEWEGVKIFYPVTKGDLPFDIFAATFFLISRYEEYLYAKRDRFDRYDPRNSIAWKNGFLYEPVVNIWLNKFGKLLKSHFPNIAIKQPKYTFQPTIDIDNAWAYLHKGFFRTAGGLAMNMVRGGFVNIDKRLKVLLRMKKDPFDTYETIDYIHEKYNLKPNIFFLMGNYGGNDKSVSPMNKSFQNLIRRYNEISHVGVHASFSSNNNYSQLTEEIGFLNEIIGSEVLSNRFHFIKIKMPASYENLIDNGITHDYSMGYASRLGFRAGFAGQFYFFNLRTNSATNLRIHTFQLMDATLNFYNKLTPSQAFEKSAEIIDKVKNVNGELTTVWHNESLSGINPWKGWGELYEKVVEYAL